MKVATIVGTRPEIIRLSRVIAALDRYSDHVLIHTGQNYDYELNDVFFHQLGIKEPKYYLDASGPNPASTIGNVIARTYEVLGSERPDAVLILGDTNSCLSAISAKRHHIPIFHMEAGNRCFDERVPEETNRRIVDHISDINLPYSEHARTYLIREGIRPERIIKTGSPMKEVLTHYLPNIQTSGVLQDIGLSKGEYFVVSAHREENVDNEENFSELLCSLNGIAEEYGLPLIVSTHPRTRNRLGEREVQLHELISFRKPLGLFEYGKLQLNARCVISDSGSVTEESSILDFPAITIRQAHERPEGMDEGVLIMTGLKKHRILEALKIVTYSAKKPRRIVSDYDTENVSDKVVNAIFSYTDFVNRNVWRA